LGLKCLSEAFDFQAYSIFQDNFELFKFNYRNSELGLGDDFNVLRAEELALVEVAGALLF